MKIAFILLAIACLLCRFVGFMGYWSMPIGQTSKSCTFFCHLRH